MKLIDKRHELAYSFLQDIKLGKKADTFSMFSSLYTGTGYKKFITFYENDIRTFALPFPSLYLFFVKNLSQIYGIQMIFVRDGMISLLNFFLRFPDPKNFNGHLIINSQFQDLIPEKWHGHVLFYHFTLNNVAKIRKGDKLNVFGHLSDSNLTERSKEIILSQVDSKRVSLFLPAKKDIYLANNKNEAPSYEFIIDIDKASREIIFFRTWSEYLLNAKPQDAFLNIDVYSKLNSFSYYEQILLAKGSFNSLCRNKFEDDILESFEMSKDHSLNISHNPSDRLFKVFKEYHIRLDIPDNKVTDTFLSIINHEILPNLIESNFYEA